MFRPTDAQQEMFGTAGLLSPQKRVACEKSWAGPFREKALPILLRAEREFAEFYDDETGRPNRSVALVLGTLILKEANDLTDEEALAALDFDLRWHYAFELRPDESHVCQKTLHNFRVKLMAGEKGAVVFRRVTDELIPALGVKVSRQRLDSTHILSNFARLNRLGLFCETIRVFLHALKKGHRDLHDRLPSGLLKRHGEESWYRDARREEGPRRLGVVARDLFRLVERFKAHRVIGKMDELKLLERLLSEQCEVSAKAPELREDDDDRGEGPAPVMLKDPQKVEGSTPAGRAGLNLARLVQGGLLYPVARAVERSGKRRAPIVVRDLRVGTGNEVVALQLQVIPLSQQGKPEHFLVLFADAHLRAPAGAETLEDESPDSRERFLERELRATKRSLESIIEKEQSTNEEMQSVNEELRSRNEEYQSSLEELRTTHEDLQSANEELATLNHDLRVRSEELDRKNSELQRANEELRRADKERGWLAAIVESSEDAIISKDLNGVITSWNAGAQRLFGYRPEEAIGRSVSMIIPPNRLPEEAEILRRMRAGERLSQYETVRLLPAACQGSGQALRQPGPAAGSFAVDRGGL